MVIKKVKGYYPLTACLLDMWSYRSAWDPVYFFAESFDRLDKHKIPLVMSEEERSEWKRDY